MARLVARAFRLGRSSLIQAGSPSAYHGRYRVSYLLPALMWEGPVVLVAPPTVQQRLLMVDIPRLQQWLPTQKSIQVGDRWPSEQFTGLLLTTPDAWLGDRLRHQHFPNGILTLLDGVDDLEQWVQDCLALTLTPPRWDDLARACPTHRDRIHATHRQITQSLLQRPSNPYHRYGLDEHTQSLTNLCQFLQTQADPLPPLWTEISDRLTTGAFAIATLDRLQEQISITLLPLHVAPALHAIWQQQPVILIGSALDRDPQASTYRQRFALGDMTCVKFLPDRQQESIQLYLPDRLPLPNTREFQPVLMTELRHLLMVSAERPRFTVILVDDRPLQSQIATILAAEYGSRVQLERTCPDDNGILVSGWQFWLSHQGVFPAPHLLIMPTLPIPSPEDPLVAARVEHYKQTRQDWFRLYLLPESLSILQRAIAPVRESQGVVALLDSRVNHRTYGRQVLEALSPMARLNYVDASLFSQVNGR